jgi:ribosomal protein S18 acetylase RimI-like enzyme
VRLRRLREDDYPYVITRLDDWWGGRHVTAMLPRLFFQHFNDTSLAAEDDDGRLIGFLCGFVSQSNPHDAYIHFVGVDPSSRNAAIARSLYEKFFDTVRSRGCTSVACITAPVNEISQRFHSRMGFTMLFQPDYDGIGGARIVMSRSL